MDLFQLTDLRCNGPTGENKHKQYFTKTLRNNGWLAYNKDKCLGFSPVTITGPL